MAKVAPKVKKFILRLIQQCLPVKASLREKSMQLETACVVCGNHEETIDHVFFSCLFSIAIWMKVFPGLQRQSFDMVDSIKFWEEILMFF